jgi:hypothetical protein
MAKTRKQAEPDEASSEAPSPAAEIPREQIAERAYEIYLARGGSDGQDWEDWLIAEREVLNGRRSPREE